LTTGTAWFRAALLLSLGLAGRQIAVALQGPVAA
jgi:hypothetical protein